MLPIGIDSFEEMITGGYYYVDKTLLIKEIRDLAGKVKLITRPRRFGKTLNMDMIRHFYAMDGKDLFEGLKIWEDKAFVKEHYHKYPVLFVTFRDIKKSNWQDAKAAMEELLEDSIANVFLSMKNTTDEKIKLLRQKYLEGRIKNYDRVLFVLTEALYRYHGKRVVLLIDEYDVPIESAYINRDEDPKYYNKMIDFMRSLLTAALKDNPYLEFAVITGVYRVAKEALFSGLNNLQEYTVFSNYMATRFGFTEEEVYELLKHYSLEGDMNAVRDWYNGYIFGDTEGIYNPWSVMKYVHERIGGASVDKALQPYWINSSGNELIIKQIETNPFLQDELEKLLSGKDLIVEIDPFLSLREIDMYPSGVWTLLASGGYLNAYHVEGEEYMARLPNKEVERFYKKSVARWIEKKTEVAIVKMVQAIKKALNGSAEELIQLLKEYLENSLSYFDIGHSDAERVYKAFVLGMLSMGSNGYTVETETETGHGRVDVAIYPKDKRSGKYALVMELKKAKSEEDLEEASQEALAQIQKKGYAAKYQKMGFKVLPIGIAFHGKRVIVKRGS